MATHYKKKIAITVGVRRPPRGDQIYNRLNILKQKHMGGIFLLGGASVTILPHKERTMIDVNCPMSEPVPITLFAYRTHAHQLGSVISGYRFDPKTDQITEIAKGNPQWPQAFYPMKSPVKVNVNDYLIAKCTYNSTLSNKTTHIGSTGNDEMCNLYLMYYTDPLKGNSFRSCWSEQRPDLTERLPNSSFTPLPPNPELEHMTHGANMNKDKEMTYDNSVEKKAETYAKIIRMPDVSPQTHDEYLCTAQKLNDTFEEWITLYKPLDSSAKRVHHLLLYGCKDVKKDFRTGAWNCGHHGVCIGNQILYAWAKNAPATHLPNDVGFKIGGKTNTKYLVLQIHYANPIPKGETDHAGLHLSVTRKPQKYMGGIFLLGGASATILPHKERTMVDVNCPMSEPVPITLFAYRTHAHQLGSVISGYRFDPKTDQITEIAKGNPQWPQAFYPMKSPVKINVNDYLIAKCTYNSTLSNKTTHIGSTGNDEMCNLYLMYYTDPLKGNSFRSCWSEQRPDLTERLPNSSFTPLPPNPELEHMTHGANMNKEKEMTYDNSAEKKTEIDVEKKIGSQKRPQAYDIVPKPVKIGGELGTESDKAGGDSGTGSAELVNGESGSSGTTDVNRGAKSQLPSNYKQLNESWRNNDTGFKLVPNWGPKKELGQITAVALDSQGHVIVFHRGSVTWTFTSFRGAVFANQKTPISVPTILHLSKNNGSIMHKWGANLFFMPHGLSVDREDNIWVTDVALHQVMKFEKNFEGSKPVLTLGERFVPGDDQSHFCKPTAVAILESGDFFVADGYCNARVIHFNADGSFVKQIGAGSVSNLNKYPPPDVSFFIPHALTLVPDKEQICVADRENGRVQCFKTESLELTKIFQFEEWGHKIYSVSYDAQNGGRLYAVNGPETPPRKLQVFVIDFEKEKILDAFSPKNEGLNNPHDLIVSADGAELYVVEIGPNNLFKFSKNLEGNLSIGHLAADPSNNLNIFKPGYSSVAVSSVVLGLVAIPAVVLFLMVIVLRVRKRSKRGYIDGNGKLLDGAFRNGFSGEKRRGVSIGSLLNSRRGFEPLSTNENEDFFDSGESDVEEFSITATKRRK